MLVLSCVSSGTDVNSEGQTGEGNGHYQNKSLLVAQQDVRAGDRLHGPHVGNLFWFVWSLTAKCKLFFQQKHGAVDRT